MTVKLICVGRLKEKFYGDACAEFKKRISRFADVNIIEVSDERAPEQLSKAEMEQVKRAEGERILAKVAPGDYLIAMDLKGIVQALGHDVTGVARTHSAAVELAGKVRPTLALADIQLADGSSGIDAVNELLADMGELPVIFITAFPERLLTGDRPEPAFLISKPYSEEQVRSAVSQAMFFASTEGLTVS